MGARRRPDDHGVDAVVGEHGGDVRRGLRAVPAASSFAGPSIGSHTQASSARGFAVTDSACTVPIRPQPNRAIRVMA